MHHLKSIALISKHANPEALKLCIEVENWLLQRDIKVFRLDKDDSNYTEQAECLFNVDLVLICGGDGTMIYEARRLIDTGIALAGINLGRVGFLFELSKHNWKTHLQKALNQGVELEKRICLNLSIQRAGEEILNKPAVNDVVISRGELPRLLSMELMLDNQKVIALRADGLIVSSPTGSTAYSSSAGGPLLHNSLKAFSITAICPFMAHMTPLVVSSNSRLNVRIARLDSPASATIDGQENFKLETDDLISITGHDDGIVFANFGNTNYYERLRRSGILGDSMGV